MLANRRMSVRRAKPPAEWLPPPVIAGVRRELHHPVLGQRERRRNPIARDRSCVRRRRSGCRSLGCVRRSSAGAQRAAELCCHGPACCPSGFADTTYNWSPTANALLAEEPVVTPAAEFPGWD